MFLKAVILADSDNCNNKKCLLNVIVNMTESVIVLQMYLPDRLTDCDPTDWPTDCCVLGYNM